MGSHHKLSVARPDSPTAEVPPQPNRHRAAWRALRVGLLALAGTVIGLMLGGHSRASIGPFDVTMQARPSTTAETVVRLAPLGTIRFDTHSAPVRVEARVEELRLDEAEAIARDPTVLEDFEETIAGDARDALADLARRSVLAGVIGGLAGTLLGALRWRSLLVGGPVVAAVMGAMLALTASSWRPQAVSEPAYSGLLSVAPQVVGDVGAIVERFGEYRAQLAGLVANVAMLYDVGRELPTFDPGRAATTRVLHVSDVHNNPQAFDLMRTIISQLGVDAVVDTGDLTDWGSEPESRLIDAIGTLGVPYVWVRGNHDSVGTAEAVASQPNAVVLDGGAHEVVGLRMWGFPDPRFTPDKSRETGTDVERQEAAALVPQVTAALEAVLPPPVDLVAVHDARMAAGIGHLTPLVLAGHTHQPRRSSIGDALLMVEGSTGGAGLRSLQGEGPEPLTCTVLYFDPASRALVAFDRVTVEGLGQSSVRIQRHLVQPQEPLASTTTVP
jgi:predicted phosphodiesterase